MSYAGIWLAQGPLGHSRAAIWSSKKGGECDWLCGLLAPALVSALEEESALTYTLRPASAALF